MSTWTTHVAGVSFPNPDGSSRQELLRALKPGNTVRVRHDWMNDFDPNAIEVIAPAGQIGYVPARVARELVRIGFQEEATVVSIRGGTPTAPTLGAEIKITTGRSP